MRVSIWIGALALWAGTAAAADLPGAWVEYAADGGVEIRAVTAPGAACPAVEADGLILPSAPRGTEDAAFPVQVCTARAAAPVRIRVAGLPAPVPPRDLRRIVVIGDTGCRLKGQAVQDCNDPAAWPFATLARLAAATRPDLVIHVGDYHYRESACPPGRPGCAGSPWGDNWPVWKADFFDPAAPLLAAAPWVLVRGNHELCSRGGHGWFRLLDPHPGLTDCQDATAPYALHFGKLALLVLDGADADDSKARQEKVAVYAGQLQTLFAEAGPAGSGTQAWLLTHRPVWGLAEGIGVPVGAMLNATEQAAIRDQVPPALDLVVSGHVHVFAAFDFGPDRPGQLVTGNGGDAEDAIVMPPQAGLELDGKTLRHGFALSEYGFLVLDRLDEGWSGTVIGVTGEALAHCRIMGRAVGCDGG